MSVDRFWMKTTTDHDKWFEGTKCILWTASHGTKSGHGRFSDTTRRFWVAHRFAWELVHGPVPDGMRLFGRCGRSLCVNDKHHELLTPTEVAERARERWQPAPTFRCCGRPRTPENSYPNGRCRPCHKITWQKWYMRKKGRKRRGGGPPTPASDINRGHALSGVEHPAGLIAPYRTL